MSGNLEELETYNRFLESQIQRVMNNMSSMGADMGEMKERMEISEKLIEKLTNHIMKGEEVKKSNMKVESYRIYKDKIEEHFESKIKELEITCNYLKDQICKLSSPKLLITSLEKSINSKFSLIKSDFTNQLQNLNSKLPLLLHNDKTFELKIEKLESKLMMHVEDQSKIDLKLFNTIDILDQTYKDENREIRLKIGEINGINHSKLSTKGQELKCYQVDRADLKIVEETLKNEIDQLVGIVEGNDNGVKRELKKINLKIECLDKNGLRNNKKGLRQLRNSNNSSKQRIHKQLPSKNTNYHHSDYEESLPLEKESIDYLKNKEIVLSDLETNTFHDNCINTSSLLGTKIVGSLDQNQDLVQNAVAYSHDLRKPKSTKSKSHKLGKE